MKIKSFHLLIIIFISCFHFASFAQENTSKIKHLSDGADVIFTGKVAKQNSSWNESKTRIFTDVTIEVEEYLKGGNNENTIVVTHLGGEVGEVGELYSHIPTFENDEEILLFVKRDERNNKYKVFQGEEGKITLLDDEKTGEKMTVLNRRLNSLKKQIKNSIKEQ
jgi:hypothetical protein